MKFPPHEGADHELKAAEETDDVQTGVEEVGAADGVEVGDEAGEQATDELEATDVKVEDEGADVRMPVDSAVVEASIVVELGAAQLQSPYTVDITVTIAF